MGKKKSKKRGQPYIPHQVDDGVNYYDDVYEQSWGNSKWYDYGGYSASSYWKCHVGNTKVLSSSKGDGGTLFIGGWSRGAYHSDDMTIIDLTAGKKPLRHRGHYYAINIDDFDVPQWSLFFWESIAMTVYEELMHGDVLIACQGGHGRSGMVTAIVAYMMSNKRHIRISERQMLLDDPVAWIRHMHCLNAVETVSQETCVYETCIAFLPNESIKEALDEIRNKPRYTSPTDKYYDEVVAEWVTEPEESEIYLCPLCLEEHGTMIEALMCCNTTNSVRYCPVCMTKHELPIDAFNCCRVAPPFKFHEDEEDDYDPITGGVKESK